MEFWVNVLIIIHFGYHALAALGVTMGLMHSHTVHKESKWKIAAAIVWLILSVLLLIVSQDTLNLHQTTCH